MKVTQIFGFFILIISYNCALGDVSELKSLEKNSNDAEVASNNINEKQDELPFTVLSGKFDDSVEQVPGVKPYFYEKPKIPFEYENQPAENENVENFSGYKYPKPNKPFPFPEQKPSSEEAVDLPPASARISIADD